MLPSILVCGAAITEYYRLDGFENRNLFSHNSVGHKSKIKVLAGLVSSETSLLGLQMTTFLLCPHAVSCPSVLSLLESPFLIRARVILD